MNDSSVMKNTNEANAALKELQNGQTSKLGTLIIRWQNDLSYYVSVKQDIEEILHHCTKIQTELKKHDNFTGCLNLLEALIKDIKEELDID